MTVAELIEKLKTMPHDAQVRHGPSMMPVTVTEARLLRVNLESQNPNTVVLS